jgi:hypothetical protein
MGKKYNQAINENLFIKFKNSFCSLLSIAASNHLIVKTNQGLQFTFNHISMYKQLETEFTSIELEIVESLIEFSTPEKLLYLIKMINDYLIENNNEKFNLFSNSNELQFKTWRIIEQECVNREILKTIINFSEIRDICPEHLELFWFYLNFSWDNQYKEEDIPNYYVIDHLSDENDEFEFNFRSNFISFFEKSAKYYFYLADKLHQLFSTAFNNYFAGNLTYEGEIEILQNVFDNNRPILVLHKELSNINRNGKLKFTEFNIKEAIIIFEKLIKHRVILDFNSYDKANLLSILTGWSKQNLQKEIDWFKEDILSGTKRIRKSNDESFESYSSDLESVYSVMNAITEELKHQIIEIKQNKILFTKKETAEKLELNKVTDLNKYISKGLLPKNGSGKKLRFKLNDIENIKNIINNKKDM